MKMSDFWLSFYADASFTKFNQIDVILEVPQMLIMNFQAPLLRVNMFFWYCSFCNTFCRRDFSERFSNKQGFKLYWLNVPTLEMPGTECGDVRGTPRHWGGDDITGQSIVDVGYCWKGTALLPRCTCGVLTSVFFLKSVEGSMVGEHGRFPIIFSTGIVVQAHYAYSFQREWS